MPGSGSVPVSRPVVSGPAQTCLLAKKVRVDDDLAPWRNTEFAGHAPISFGFAF